MTRLRTVLMVTLTVLLVLGGQLTAFGQPSLNHLLRAVPAPGPVTIDGDVSEWDRSGEIWVYPDQETRDLNSLRVAAMYDNEAFYLAGIWRDPSPMIHRTLKTGKSDSLTIHLETDVAWAISISYYTTAGEPRISMSASTRLNPHLKENLKVEDPFAEGAELAYRKDAGGKGYVHELKLPWKLLFRGEPGPVPGASFAMSLNPRWGFGQGTSGFKATSYRDLISPVYPRWWASTSNTTVKPPPFTPAMWGRCLLEAHGNLEPLTVAEREELPTGVIPLTIEVPRQAKKFTVVIDDAEGKRVRNLISDHKVEDYPTSQTATTRKLQVWWDGCDDEGELVAPGQYQVRGLSHRGLDVTYQLSYYNPGTPPWQVTDGTGDWGADHACPVAVACAGDKAFLGWPLNEGGTPAIAVNIHTMKKIWHGPGHGHIGDDRLAATEKYLFCAHRNGFIVRRDANTGEIEQMVWFKNEPIPEYKRPTGLPLLGIGASQGSYGNRPHSRDFFYQDQGGLRDIAANDRYVALSLNGNDMIALLDPETFELLKKFSVTAPDSLDFGPNELLYVVTEGRIVRMDVETEKRAAVPTPGVGKYGAIAVDSVGNVYVADLGPDMQVKCFDKHGKLIRTFGKKGGRPDEGRFDPQGMRYMSSIDVDAKGRVWVCECDDRPRRFSVWGTDGKLVKDYIGNTGYHACGAHLHPTDPTRAFGNAMEFKLNYQTQEWELVKTLWRQRPGEYLGLHGTQNGLNVHAQYLISEASGQRHEYIIDFSNSGYIIMMPEGDHWKPVSALSKTKGVFGFDRSPVQGPFVGHERDSFTWFDENGDGKPQPEELDFFQPYLRRGGGFTAIVGDDLVLYITGGGYVWRVPPARWSEEGAPVYEWDKAEQFMPGGEGAIVPVKNGYLRLPGSKLTRIGKPTGLNKDKEVVWTYPHPTPHYSPPAQPQPGVLIAIQRTCGVVDMGEEIGEVFSMRCYSNEHFMTTDGLYVGRVFRDVRTAPAPMPDEIPPPGTSINDTSLTVEPWSGFLNRYPDGRILMIAGDHDWRVCEVLGLDTIKRFGPEQLAITEEQVAKAKELHRQRQAREAARQAGPGQMTIARFTPIIDGKLDEWAQENAAAIKSGRETVAQAWLGYDQESLYLAYDVEDSSPMINTGRAFERLFKTGDAVDLKLATNPEAAADRTKASVGDLRVLISVMNDEPVAVLYRPVVAAGKPKNEVEIASYYAITLDDVHIIPEAQIKIIRQKDSYTVEAAIPLTTLRWKPEAGMALKGDVGVIFSDAAGTVNLQRVYWANKTYLVCADAPREATLHPDVWGPMPVE